MVRHEMSKDVEGLRHLINVARLGYNLFQTAYHARYRAE